MNSDITHRDRVLDLDLVKERDLERGDLERDLNGAGAAAAFDRFFFCRSSSKSSIGSALLRLTVESAVVGIAVVAASCDFFLLSSY